MSKPFWLDNRMSTRSVWLYLLSRLTTVMIFQTNGTVIFLENFGEKIKWKYAQ